MRIERWFWLPVFCIVLLLMHLTAAYVTHAPGGGSSAREAPSIEVAFEPTVTPLRPKPQPKVVPPKPKLRPSVARGPHPAIVATFRAATVRRTVPTERPLRPASVPLTGLKLIAKAVTPRPAAPTLPDSVQREAPSARRAPERVALTPSFHINRTDPRLVEGGGSPSLAPVPGGTGGFKAPEAPKDDVMYTGGGRGDRVVAALPKIGGGGGRSILSVKGDNPLGDALPDDKPGIGPGSGGGQGTGAKGGIGFATGKGIGTQGYGKVALGSLHHLPGVGIGAAAAGSQVGTRAPGGGRGRGAELPGTGGTGNGYGRGHGSAIGDGADASAPPARMRGVPFGNVAGLLGGDNNGGPRGAPGRGGVFGTRIAGGGQGAIHIIYALDISGSMQDGHKIDKAREELKRALSGLHRADTFNIIVFKKDARTFADDSVPATPSNIINARQFVDDIRVGDGTNISGAMDLAFGMNGITHIYLMSDGEPNGGIGDFAELRRFIREKNTHNVTIMTLALGLGENFPGMRLLKGIAEDNHGIYTSVDLTAKFPTAH